VPGEYNRKNRAANPPRVQSRRSAEYRQAQQVGTGLWSHGRIAETTEVVQIKLWRNFEIPVANSARFWSAAGIPIAIGTRRFRADKGSDCSIAHRADESGVAAVLCHRMTRPRGSGGWYVNKISPHLKNAQRKPCAGKIQIMTLPNGANPNGYGKRCFPLRGVINSHHRNADAVSLGLAIRNCKERGLTG
jgi:hypothetical protein